LFVVSGGPSSLSFQNLGMGKVTWFVCELLYTILGGCMVEHDLWAFAWRVGTEHFVNLGKFINNGVQVKFNIKCIKTQD